MRIFTILLLVSFVCYGKTSVTLGVGSTKNDALSRAADYSISLEQSWGQGLGLELGLSFMQATYGNSDVTIVSFPSAGITHTFKLNRLPFKLSLAAGFSLFHTPETLGNHYVGTYLSGSVIYIMDRKSYLSAKYRSNYGKNKVNGSYINFDGQTISVGLGFYLDQRRKKTKLTPNMKGIQQNPMSAPRKRRPIRRNGQGSPYQQTQKLMNDLSWPTY